MKEKSTRVTNWVIVAAIAGFLICVISAVPFVLFSVIDKKFYSNSQNCAENLKPGGMLNGCDFQNADLSGLDLTGAKLRSTNLIGANLSNTIFRDAFLQGADIDGANFSGAVLDGAIFDDVPVRNVTGLTNDMMMTTKSWMLDNEWSLNSTFQPACEGSPLEFTTAYTNSGIQPVIIIGDMLNLVPSEWRSPFPESSDQLAYLKYDIRYISLVVCLSDVTEVFNITCKYQFGSEIDTYVKTRSARLVESATGKTISETTLRGHPPTCPEFASGGSRTGSEPNFLEHVRPWLEPYVVFP